MEDFAAVWCEWAEMEIRQKAYSEALAVMQQAVTEPPRRSAKQQLTQQHSEIPVRDRVHRSVKLWAFYIDLEVRSRVRVPARRPASVCMCVCVCVCRSPLGTWPPRRPRTTVPLTSRW